MSGACDQGHNKTEIGKIRNPKSCMLHVVNWYALVDNLEIDKNFFEKKHP
jgi:hypothetical protein